MSESENPEGIAGKLQETTDRRSVLKKGAAMIFGASAFGAMLGKLAEDHTGAVSHANSLSDRGDPNHPKPDVESPQVQSAQTEASPNSETEEPIPLELPENVEARYVIYGDLIIDNSVIDPVTGKKDPINFRTSPEIKNDPDLGPTNLVTADRIMELEGFNVENQERYGARLALLVSDKNDPNRTLYWQVRARVRDDGGRDDEKTLYAQISENTDQNTTIEVDPSYFDQGGENYGLAYASLDENQFLHLGITQDQPNAPIVSSAALNQMFIPESPTLPHLPPTE